MGGTHGTRITPSLGLLPYCVRAWNGYTEPMGLWLWLGSLIGAAAAVIWIRRYTAEYDGYYEREYRDPPTTGIPGHLGGGL